MSTDRRWRSELAVRVAYVPWEKREWRPVADALADAVVKFTTSPYVSKFFGRQLAALVFGLNRMEGTLGEQHEEGPTMVLLTGFLRGDTPEPAVTPWNAEGGRDASATSSRRQLFQCCAAAKSLLRDSVSSPLSVELIVHTHALMMAGSVNDDGTPVVVGRMRCLPSEEAGAGVYTFTPPRAVNGCVGALIEDYNERLSKCTLHPVALATYLFYELITIHPFGNGNGRLCRLFLAWSLLKTGFPFPVSFSTGHRRCRQHYLHAINTARRIHEGNRGELNVICLLSTERVFGDFMENASLLAQGPAADEAAANQRAAYRGARGGGGGGCKPAVGETAGAELASGGPSVEADATSVASSLLS